MVAILRVPGVMFQQRGVPACSTQTDSATINFCGQAVEDQNQPPSVISGAISGAGAALGTDCTGFTVGNPPEEDAGADQPDAEGDVEQPEDVTEYVDTDGDGEPDEVVDDGETPEVHDDGEIFDFEDGEVEEDGDVVEDGETADPCANSPVISATTSPVDGEPAVILTPTLDWDAGDLDAGDTLTYRVRVWLTSDPSTALVDETVTDSQYIIPTGILANNVNYSWQIDAWDSCSPTPHLISSPIWTFTTERACAPYSFTDTDFTTGTLGGGAVANAGSLRLQEDYSAYTGRYEGDVNPETVGWTQTGSYASRSIAGGVITLDNLGTNAQGYYQINAGFDAARGSVVEVVSRVEGQDDVTPPSFAGFSLRGADGNRLIDLRFYTDQVCESTNTGLCYVYPDPSVPHQHRLEFQGDDFRLYVDGVLAIDGTGWSLADPGGANVVRFGDVGMNPDARTAVDYVYWSNLDDHIPFSSPGTYTSAAVDTSVDDYDFSGSTINWTPPTAGGTVTVAVRAANDLISLESAPFSAEVSGSPATIPAGVTGRYLQWRITITAPATPTTTPVVDEVDGGRTCP